MTDTRSPIMDMDVKVLKEKLESVIKEIDISLAGLETRLSTRREWHRQYVDSISGMIYADIMKTALGQSEETLEEWIDALNLIKSHIQRCLI